MAERNLLDDAADLCAERPDPFERQVVRWASRGLMVVILVIWLAVFFSDRIHLWLRANRLRRETRREVRQYTTPAAC